jgi:hypothetical protein
MFGITEGQARLSAEGHYYKTIFSGTAPGLFLMVIAGLALLMALLKGGIKADTKDKKKDKLSRDDTAKVMSPSLQGHEAIDHGKQIAEGGKTTVTLAAKDWIGAGKKTETIETEMLAQPNRARLFSRITEIKGEQSDVKRIIQQIERERHCRLGPEAKEKIRNAENALTSGGKLIIDIEEGAHETHWPAGALIAEIEEDGRKESLKDKIRPIFSNKP